MQPVPPKNLNPYARELLERMAGHEEAAEIVIGGGVALSHYLEYRGTVDLDSWWRQKRNEDVVAFVAGCMKEMAAQHGLSYRYRDWGETESLELMRGGQKEFSFQISKRTLYLDSVIPTEWRPLWIETLRDNIASKMTALVKRGAPRDFSDIYRIVHAGVLSSDECWRLYTLKNPDVPADEARRKVLAKLEMIAVSRPLENIQPLAARQRAALVRDWYRTHFCAHTP